MIRLQVSSVNRWITCKAVHRIKKFYWNKTFITKYFFFRIILKRWNLQYTKIKYRLCSSMFHIIVINWNWISRSIAKLYLVKSVNCSSFFVDFFPSKSIVLLWHKQLDGNVIVERNSSARPFVRNMATLRNNGGMFYRAAFTREIINRSLKTSK